MTLLREPVRTILLVASLALAITDIERPRTADADRRDQRVTTGAERLPVLHEHPGRPDPRAGVQHELEPQRAEVPAARESEGDAREGESARDADWLVRDLLDLRWIVSIRIE
jgi:hypothetical protein